MWLLQYFGFMVEIREVSTLFPAAEFWILWDSTPRVSRPDKTNPPPGADVSTLPSGHYYAI